MPAVRQDRINEVCKQSLSEAMRAMKDPRLSSMCAVTQAEVTRDLKHAKVKVSVYGTEEERKLSIEALNSAKGFLMRELAEKMQLRRVPTLHFELDNSIEYSIHISKVIDEISAARKENSDD